MKTREQRRATRWHVRPRAISRQWNFVTSRVFSANGIADAHCCTTDSELFQLFPLHGGLAALGVTYRRRDPSAVGCARGALIGRIRQRTSRAYAALTRAPARAIWILCLIKCIIVNAIFNVKFIMLISR